MSGYLHLKNRKVLKSVLYKEQFTCSFDGYKLKTDISLAVRDNVTPPLLKCVNFTCVEESLSIKLYKVLKEKANNLPLRY